MQENDFIQKINQARVLTMSNNMKFDYLVIDTTLLNHNNGKEFKLLMIKCNDNGKIDIVPSTIFQIYANRYDNIIDDIIHICEEYGIENIIINSYGFGFTTFDMMHHYIKNNNINIKCHEFSLYGREEIKKLTNIIISEIENSNIRFLMHPDFAKQSYKNKFLGYKEIMNKHKETTGIINQLINVNYNENANGNTDKKDMYTLYAYYGYINSIGEIDERLRMTREEILNRFRPDRVKNNSITYGIFTNNRTKAINKILEIKSQYSDDEIRSFSVKGVNGIELILNNGIFYKWMNISEHFRGHRCYKAYIDEKVTIDEMRYIIEPICIFCCREDIEVF